MYTSSATKLLLLSLLSILVVCSCGSFLFPVKNNDQKELKQAHGKKSRRASSIGTIRHDFVNPAVTTFPTNPVTNPATVPVTTPAIVTVPSANPATVTPTPANPVMYPPVPVTNPVTTPTVPGGQQPVTNPMPNNPNPPPPLSTTAPAVPGQSWCVARGGEPEMALQAALDYACGIGGADCSAIQEGASCYNPNSLEVHASYAFNSYYQRNPVQTSCDFGGTAVITNVNPSSGSCIFTTRSPSSASPTTPSPLTTTPTPTPLTTTPTPSPITTTPTTPVPFTMTPPSTPITPTPITPTPNTDPSSGAATPTSLGTPPGVLNPANPALGGGTTSYGESPLAPNSSSISMSSSLRTPFIGYIALVTSLITGRILLGV